jgi:tRNA(fMet)-specific endonuclease VapC
MKYLLDTNACIEVMRHGAVSLVSKKLGQLPLQDVVLCSVVLFELRIGVERSTNRHALLQTATSFLSRFSILPFQQMTAELAASLRVQLEGQGTPIGPYDLFIAATAVAFGLILVTHNTREFSRVPGLVVEDWQLAP